MVHLLRPTRRKRGVQPAAPLPDFEPFTEEDFRVSTGGLVPQQVSCTERTAACPAALTRLPLAVC
jgi:hypothetical protein